MEIGSLEYIETYFDGTMNAAERLVFEQRLIDDPILLSEYEKYKDLRTGFESIQMKNTEAMLRSVAQVRNKDISKSNVFTLRRIMSIAAAIIVIATAVFLLKPSSNNSIQEITAAYYVAPMSSIERTESTISSIDLSVISFQNGDYQEALKLLNNANDEALERQDEIAYWKGHVYYKMFNFSEAAQSFSMVKDLDAQSKYASDAHWMYVLSILNSAKDVNESKELLQSLIDQNQGQYSNLAKKLLSELK